MLITNWTFGDRRDVDVVGRDARSSWWSINAIDSRQSRDSWRGAFGTFEWDHLQQERSCMLVFGDDTTDTTNAFNEDLLARTQIASYAYLLNRPPFDSGGILWMASGIADSKRQPLTLPSFRQTPKFWNPYFVQRPAFEPDFQAVQSNAWIDDWCADFSALDAARGGNSLVSPPLDTAILSLVDASINGVIDFRLASLVRTIEALIAVPAGPGQKKTFVQRAGLFSAAAMKHPGFVAANRSMPDALADLYQLRSDVVHGKWPLTDMQKAGREDYVAVLDYVVETVARTIIKWAIRNRTTFAGYQTRMALEAAWAAGSIPPP